MTSNLLLNKNNTNFDNKKNAKQTYAWYAPSILESYFRI